ncbi:vacuolar protein sorting/targeting protein PEP1 [Psilocybe cubensis]|uniref:Vacuolar protein sorting/targeting protein 10 n=2 Tax=Psilocybe cubensis TaxID=181762 RepID=A0A8H7XSQ7_PSICU|nr:vacuolar protein sorting/targeting protein PEP1 [Psilocybe cubensis]KAH9479087.1 vacuolar protein sorting/targeting protein PEP1 [Psilocybe cubensis]
MTRRRNGAAALCRALLLSLSTVFVAGQSQPDHTISSFSNLPARMFFFDDTESVIYHDSMQGDVYVSLDEGKSWKTAEGIPSGRVSMVFEHPTDNRYAFALTDGKTHYRTQDRGKTWRPFDVPLPPALVPRPLSFHSDPSKYGYILYQGSQCDRQGWGARCHDETFYTKEAFTDDVKPLLKDVSHCQFAHSTKDFKHEAHEDLIYCVAFDSESTSSSHDLSSSRLYSSTDFFKSEKNVEDLGIGKNAKGVIAFAIVSQYAVVALKDLSAASTGEMLLYVTVDTKTWAKAQFPHASSATLRENAYTMLESTTHSLAVDVKLQERNSIGTLFVSNSNGTFFVESLKDTNRNDAGFVDFEKIYGVEGIGLANIVSNAQEVEGRGSPKRLRSLITFNDGRQWTPLAPPKEDVDGKKIGCDTSDPDHCSLHLHSVTAPHNFGRIFSSPAPGFVMGVGSVGESLLPYTDSDTFLSTDGGVSWKMVSKGAHKYEFGDLGSILVMVDDEDPTDEVKYSLDLGKSWQKYNIGVRLTARALVTLPDSTSQKFLLLGSVSKNDQKGDIGRVVVVYLDFAKTRGRKCGNDDYEKWFARPHDSECLMGHKQWYKRRKVDANCYVGEKFKDPVTHEENCKCTDADYECDYNFVKVNGKCEPAGPEPIPAGECAGGPESTYMGSSGYRKIPGNTCEGGVEKGERIKKPCSLAQPAEGEITHTSHQFHSQIVQHAYFKGSQTILVRLNDHTIWQSSNEGYSFRQLFPDVKFYAFYHHKYSTDRAYLITDTRTFYYTTDTGKNWFPREAPTPPSPFPNQVISFHPQSEYLIWTGNRDCDGNSLNCHAEAQYSRDNGHSWTIIDGYVRNCAFAKDRELDADPSEILCESYRDKKGSQRTLEGRSPLELVVGRDFYREGGRKKMFDWVVGYAKFSEFLIVAEMNTEKRSLGLQVSLDGAHFASGQFPPNLNPETHAYTVLESSTNALFLHMTISEAPAPLWGTILKSNSNGTYFGISIENVNRDRNGYVDFEKLIGLDGIALINVVANPDEAKISGKKVIQSRITHNDGSTWTPLNPPLHDSQGREYPCSGTKCQLHIHGYTERNDPRASYSSPSIPGLVMAVGNVGESLAPYTESDTFLSRDGGFTWQEVHKDAHLWEFGDSGSILVLANDEEPVDFVLFSTDEGLNWRQYKFSEEKMRVRKIVTVPEDTSRKFILMGEMLKTSGTAVVHIDFSSLTLKQCVMNIEDPGHDDFELWSPSEERPEQCLFGRQTLYHRRVRDANCVVGNQPKAAERTVEPCACTKVDFECEFNYVKNANDECVLVPGTTPLPDDDSCSNGEDFWYERTPYRKIPFSSCVDGYRPDRGAEHVCPGFKSKGGWFWFLMLLLPFGFTALVAYYYYRKSGLARGTIRLPGDSRPAYGGDTGVLATLASVPWFIIGLAGIAWEWVVSRADTHLFRSRRGYRNVPIDEDAQILRFEDDE